MKYIKEYNQSPLYKKISYGDKFTDHVIDLPESDKEIIRKEFSKYNIWFLMNYQKINGENIHYMMFNYENSANRIWALDDRYFIFLTSDGFGNKSYECDDMEGLIDCIRKVLIIK